MATFRSPSSRTPVLLAAFTAFMVGAGWFVWHTGQQLPAVSAVHFELSGVANGYMPRRYYLQGMVLFVAALPLLLGLVVHRALGKPDAPIGLPQAAWWLAAERRGATVAWLRRFFLLFPCLLSAFLAWAHWMVVQANHARPAQMEMGELLGGLGVFIAAVLVATAVFVRHFRRVPPGVAG